MNKKKAIVSDECLSQADECYKFGSNTGQNHNKTAKKKQTGKNAVDKPASQVTAGSTDDKTGETLDGVGTKASTKEDSAAWSQNQQKQLELALQQFPKTVADRWTCIAQAVPGKTKVGFCGESVNGYLTIIPRARMGSESIALQAEGRIGY